MARNIFKFIFIMKNNLKERWIKKVKRAFTGFLKIKDKKLVDVFKLLELANYFDTPLPFYEALKNPTTQEAHMSESESEVSDSESESEEEVEY